MNKRTKMTSPAKILGSTNITNRNRRAESHTESSSNNGKILMLPMIAAVLEGCVVGGGDGVLPQKVLLDSEEMNHDGRKSSSKQIVEGSSGNNKIVTGTANDEVTGGDGDDTIRTGAGADTVDAGGGDDVIVVVGANTPDSASFTLYTIDDLTNPRDSGIDVSSIVSLDEVNNNPYDEGVGDIIDGGTHTTGDTLIVYGTTDLRYADIRNIENIIINSDVTFNAQQLQDLGLITITGGDGSFIRLRAINGEEAVVSLSDLDLEGVEYIDIGPDVMVVAEDSDDLEGIELVLGLGEIQVTADDREAFDEIILLPGVTVSIDGGSESTTIPQEPEGDIETFGGTITLGAPLPGGGLRFVSLDQTSDGYAAPNAETFDGTNNRDSFVMGPDDTATGNGGSDYFIIEARFLAPGDTSFSLSYTITDFRKSVDYIVLDGIEFVHYDDGSGGIFENPAGENAISLTFDAGTETLTVSQAGRSEQVYQIVLEGITSRGEIITADSFEFEYSRQSLFSQSSASGPHPALHIWLNTSPSIHAPDTISVKEGKPFLFDAFDGVGLSVSDPNTQTLKVVLSVSNGVLFVSSDSVIVLGAGTNRISMQGTQSEINAILRGLSYEANAGDYRPDYLNIEAQEIKLTGGAFIGPGRFEQEAGETTTARIEIEAAPKATSKTSFKMLENDPSAAITFTAIDPDGGAVTYEIAGGNAEGLFVIDSDTGEITLTAALDKEYINPRGFNDVRDPYRLLIRVTDDEGAVTDTRITVDIRNVDEPPVVQDGLVFVVNEYVEATAPSGRYVIGYISASQPDDSWGGITFRVEGDESSLFDARAVDHYDGDDARIRLVSGQESLFDYESGVTEYTLTIVATERDWIGEDLETTVTATVRVRNVDEKATDIFLDNTLISPTSDTSLGSIAVGALTSNDPDGGGQGYSIVGVTLDGQPVSGVFVINRGMLRIARDATIAELGAEYEVTVAWNGYSTLTNEKTFTVRVAGASLPDTFTIDENEPVSREIRLEFGGLTNPVVTAADGDGVTLVNGNTIRVSGTYDYEELNGRLPITLTIQHDGGAEFTQTVYAPVEDVNDAPTPGETAYTFSVTETAAIGDAVGAVSATDDDGDTLAYSITSGNTNNAFSINPVTGAITVNGALDHEDIGRYTLTVTISQGEGLPVATTEVTVDVSNVNEAPVFASSSYSFTVDEATSYVGTVSATDDDIGDRLTYQITRGNDAGTFQIDSSTGVITVADGQELDYDFGTRSFSLTVRVRDGDNERDSVTVDIAIADVDESPLFPETAYVVAIDEDEIGELQANVAYAFDPELEAITYSITSNPDRAPIDINPTTGALIITAPLDYETSDEFSVEVSATDPAGHSGSTTLSVVVSDVNEAPSSPALDGNHISATADTAPGPINIGTLSATDPEGESVGFELVSVVLDRDGSDVTAGFVIDENGKLQIRQGHTITAVAGDTYTVTVRATTTDGGPASGNTEITINAGGGVALDSTYSIDENDGDIHDIDITFDGLDNPTLESATIGTGTVEVINSLSGAQLRVTGPFDFEALANGYVEVEVTVSHGDRSVEVEGIETANRETITQTLYIQINDVTEPAPVSSRQLVVDKQSADNEKTQTGTDGMDRFKYGIDSSDGGVFGFGVSNIIHFDRDEDKLLLIDSDAGDKLDYSGFLSAYGNDYSVSAHRAEALGLASSEDLGAGEYDTIQIDFSSPAGGERSDSGEASIRVVLSEKINPHLLRADSNMFIGVDEFMAAIGGEEALLFG